jgi:hypothetical protein
MPEDQALATIIAICDLMKHGRYDVKTVAETYERALKDIMEYRRSKGLTEIGGLPGK